MDQDYFNANGLIWLETIENQTTTFVDKVSAANQIVTGLSQGLWISEREAQRLDKVTGCELNELDAQLLTASYLQLTKKQRALGPRSLMCFGELLTNPTTQSLASQALKLQTIWYGTKLPGDVITKLSALINDAGMAPEIREDALWAVSHQATLRTPLGSAIVSEIERCYAEEKQLSITPVCASAFQNLAQSGQLSEPSREGVFALLQMDGFPHTLDPSFLSLLVTLSRHHAFSAATILPVGRMVETATGDSLIRVAEILGIQVIDHGVLLDHQIIDSFAKRINDLSTPENVRKYFSFLIKELEMKTPFALSEKALSDLLSSLEKGTGLFHEVLLIMATPFLEISAVNQDITFYQDGLETFANHLQKSKTTLDENALSLLAALALQKQSIDCAFKILNAHVHNKGSLPPQIVEALFETSDVAPVIALIEASSKHHAITSHSILDSLGYFLTLEHTNEKDKIEKILTQSQKWVSDNVKTLLEQEELSKQLGFSPEKNLKILNAFLKMVHKGHKMTWNGLLSLKTVFNDRMTMPEIEIAVSLIDCLLSHHHPIPSVILETLLDVLPKENPSLLPFLLKLAEKTKVDRKRIFSVLSEAVRTDCLEEIVNLIRILATQGSYPPVTLLTRVHDSVMSTEKSKLRSDLLQFYDYLMVRNVPLSERILSHLHIEELSPQSLLFKSSLSYQPTTLTVDRLFSQFEQGTPRTRAHALSRLEAIHAQSPLSGGDLAVFQTFQSILAFHQAKKVDEKAFFAEKGLQWLSERTAPTIISTLRSGLELEDKALLRVCLEGLRQSAAYVPIDLTDDEREIVIAAFQDPALKQASTSFIYQILFSLGGVKTAWDMIRKKASFFINNTVLQGAALLGFWPENKIFDLHEMAKEGDEPFLGSVNKTLIANLLEDVEDAYTFDKFQSQLRTLENSPDSLSLSLDDRLLKQCVDLKNQYRLSLADISTLLDLAILSENKVSFSLGTEETQWLTHQLHTLLPNSLLTTRSISEISTLLEKFSLPTKNKLLNLVKGFDHVKDMREFLIFLDKHEIQDEVISSLDHTIELSELKQKLQAYVLTKAIPHFPEMDHEQWNCLEKNMHTLMGNGWELNTLLSLLSLADIENAQSFADAVQTLTDYHLPEHSTSENDSVAFSFLKETPHHQWLKQLNSLALSYHFPSMPLERDTEDLFTTILGDNPHNVSILTLFQNGTIRQILEDSQTAEQKPSTFFPQGKKVEQWMSDDISLWKEKIFGKPIEAHLPEVIAVIKRGLFLAQGLVPRTVQLMAALALYKSENGRLAEVMTGQGKSMIVAIFSMMKALEGKTIDVITSSSVLAQRDASEQSGFYNLFGFTVGDNTNKINVAQKRTAYAKHILYGDIASFAGDVIAHEHLEQGFRGRRGFHVAVVDEVDNMLIDESSHVVKLSQVQPTFEFLEPALIALWDQFLLIQKQFMEEDDGLFWRPHLLDGESQSSYKVEDKNAFVKELLTTYAHKIIDDELVAIPVHLKDFAQHQSTHWPDSIIRASLLKENIDYVIADQEGHRNIAPVDYRNTGVTQIRTEWSDGVHQFLQIKHGLKIKAESLTTCFMSNMAFFKRYGPHIYGMTGTLGAHDEQELLKRIYGVDVVRIPTFKPRQFLELPSLVTSVERWIPTVTESIQREIQKGRAVLVIAQTIHDAEVTIKEALLARGIPRNKIRVYTRSELKDKTAVTKKVGVGEVVIATNIAGRGTDIKTTADLEANGGLHVCVTFLPKNLRVQKQAFGRTSRQSNRGTAQLIFPFHGAQSAEKILEWRDGEEKNRLQHDQLYRISKIALQDELFGSFSSLIKTMRDQKMGPMPRNGIRMCYTHDKACKAAHHEIDQVTELWGIWLKKTMDLIEKSSDASGDEDASSILSQQNAVRSNVLASYGTFKEDIQSRYMGGDIAQNPSYLIQIGLENKDHAALDKAIAVSGEHAAPAHLAKARVTIETANDAKGAAIAQLQSAEQLIETFMIPRIEADIHMLGIADVRNNENDIGIQALQKIEFLRKHVEYIQKNINIIAGSSSDELIRVARVIPLATLYPDSLAKTHNITYWENELQELSNMGMGHVFEVEPYIEEDDSWFGAFFSAVAGVFQILLGLTLAAVPGFGQYFGIGMVIEGISDIFSSVRSWVTNQPFHIGSYLKEKGMSYAINLISSGISSSLQAAEKGAAGAQKVAEKGTQKGAEKAAQKVTVKEIEKEFMKQGFIRGLGITLDVVGQAALKEHKDEMKEKVSARIQKLLTTHDNLLRKILASDKWYRTSHGRSALLIAAQNVLARHGKRFHSAAETIAKGVLSRTVTGGAFISAGISVGQGLDKAMEATDIFCDELLQELYTLAGKSLSSSQMLTDYLGYQGFSQEQLTPISNTLMVANVIQNQEIQQEGCARISTLDFGLPEAYTAAIAAACHIVSGYFTQGHETEVKAIHNSLTNLLTNSLMGIIRHEVVNPVGGLIAGYGGAFLTEQLFKSQQNLEADAAAEKKAAATHQKTKPVAQKTPEAPHKKISLQDILAADPDLPFADKERIMILASTVGTSAGSVAQVHVLSEALGRPISIYKDRKLDIEFKDPSSGSHGAERLIVNYNSARGTWSYPGQVATFDSVYAVVAAQLPRMTSGGVRHLVQDWMGQVPRRAASLSALYERPLPPYRPSPAPSPPTPSPMPPSSNAKGGSRTGQRQGTQKTTNTGAGLPTGKTSPNPTPYASKCFTSMACSFGPTLPPSSLNGHTGWPQPLVRFEDSAAFAPWFLNKLAHVHDGLVDLARHNPRATAVVIDTAKLTGEGARIWTYVAAMKAGGAMGAAAGATAGGIGAIPGLCVGAICGAGAVYYGEQAGDQAITAMGPKVYAAIKNWAQTQVGDALTAEKSTRALCGFALCGSLFTKGPLASLKPLLSKADLQKLEAIAASFHEIPFLTEKQVFQTMGIKGRNTTPMKEYKGLFLTTESPKGKQAAQDFQSGTAGAFSSIEHGKMVVPALAYENPNPRGWNCVKFDGMEKMADGTTVLLIDAKRKLAIWSDSPQKSTVATLDRVKSALEQNPGHKVVYEFPNAVEAGKASKFIEDKGFNHVVSVRVREQ